MSVTKCKKRKQKMNRNGKFYCELFLFSDAIFLNQKGLVIILKEKTTATV